MFKPKGLWGRILWLFLRFAVYFIYLLALMLVNSTVFDTEIWTLVFFFPPVIASEGYINIKEYLANGRYSSKTDY